MTVTEARKILGEVAHRVSDEEIMADINAAELFKNFFFHTQGSGTRSKTVVKTGK